MSVKKCSKCGDKITKENSIGKVHTYCYCKVCSRNNTRERYRKLHNKGITKRCIACDKSHDVILFHKDKSSTDGYNNTCVECYKKKSINDGEYYTLTKGERWEDRNSEYRSNYHKNYRKNNQETVIRGRLLTSSRGRARKKEMEFDLNKEWLITKLEAGTCSRSKLPFVYEANSPFTPSIDRIDSSKGYTQDNCQVVCNIYNFAKNIWSDDDVLKMAKALIKESKNKVSHSTQPYGIIPKIKESKKNGN